MKPFLHFVLDVVVIVLVWYVAVGRRDAPPAPERLVAAAAATKPLTTGTKLDASDLSVELRYVPPDATVIADPKTAVGQHLTYPLRTGQVLMETMVAPIPLIDAPKPGCVILALPVKGGPWRGTLPRRTEWARVWLEGQKTSVIPYARVIGASDADADDPYVRLEVLPATAERVALLAKADSRFWVAPAPIAPPSVQAPKKPARKAAPPPPRPPCEQPTP